MKILQVIPKNPYPVLQWDGNNHETIIEIFKKNGWQGNHFLFPKDKSSEGIENDFFIGNPDGKPYILAQKGDYLILKIQKIPTINVYKTLDEILQHYKEI
jgi:hypothetical protein